MSAPLLAGARTLWWELAGHAEPEFDLRAVLSGSTRQAAPTRITRRGRARSTRGAASLPESCPLFSPPM